MLVAFLAFSPFESFDKSKNNQKTRKSEEANCEVAGTGADEPLIQKVSGNYKMELFPNRPLILINEGLEHTLKKIYIVILPSD